MDKLNFLSSSSIKILDGQETDNAVQKQNNGFKMDKALALFCLEISESQVVVMACISLSWLLESAKKNPGGACVAFLCDTGIRLHPEFRFPISPGKQPEHEATTLR